MKVAMELCINKGMIRSLRDAYFDAKESSNVVCSLVETVLHCHRPPGNGVGRAS
jgi:hypothetical protein